ncbi:MAG: metallophosphoesterase [Wujia sp.]
MTYVISDVHGEYNQFMELLKKIHFGESDTLYVLGDVVDRGVNPIKVLQYMMTQPNIVPIVGNHEIMAITCLKLLLNEITEDFLKRLSIEDYGQLADWMLNGGSSTIQEFVSLDTDEKQKVLDYIGEFIAYEELNVEGKDYLLVHAGIDDFIPDKPMEEYAIDDLVWKRTDYEIPYFEDKYVVSGHTPTQGILGNKRPGYIYRANNHIAIDCGACRHDGRLAAICLETGEEFYSR